ncbi:hypothetical protein TL16_g05328 [Triparma laevis f. inornata]|uniref:Ion transport domain-containing protein n=1 Tax=Triparma laevis f. inornata TaxID=1714386 RepID=A0A9W7ADR7_9STRA|nr:hypothetical protein TL16_g05328 [Triparma laevis f. inornata]
MEILSGGSKGGTTDKNIILYTLNALSKNSEKKKDKEELEEGIRVLEVYSLALSQSKTYVAIGTKFIYIHKLDINEVGDDQEGESDDFEVNVENKDLAEEKCNGTDTMHGHDDWITCLRFTKAEDKLVSSSRDHKVMVWCTSSRQPLKTFHHPDVVMGVDFTNYENVILTTCDDQTARLWDIQTEEKNPTVLQEYPGRHGGMVSEKNIVVSRFGSEVISWRLGYQAKKDQKTSKNGDLGFRDGDIIFRYPHDSTQLVRAAVFTPDGHTIMSATDRDPHIHFNYNVSSLNYHLPSATHNMLSDNFNQSEDFPGKFKWKQSDVGRLLERNPDSIVEPLLTGRGCDNEDGLKGQNLVHFAADNDITGYLDNFLTYGHAYSGDKQTNERLQRIAMAAVLMKDSKGRCPLELALSRKNGGSVNAILQCYSKILSPELASFAESNRSQEVHLSELIDVNLLIKSLKEFPFITLNFLKTLELLPSYKVVKDYCDRAPLPEATQDVRGSAEERSPPEFWSKLYYKEEQKVTAKKRKESYKRKSRSTMQSDFVSTNRGLGKGVNLSKITGGGSNIKSSATHPSTIDEDSPYTDDDDGPVKDDTMMGKPLLPVTAKLVPIKGCSKPEFLSALKAASEKTNDYRVFENEVIMSIVQFKWKMGFGRQYYWHFFLEGIMVVTFSIDATFISCLTTKQDQEYFLTGYFVPDDVTWTEDPIAKLTYWAYRAPLGICALIWVYFLQHECKQHLSSYIKEFGNETKGSAPTCWQGLGFEKSGQLVRIIVGVIHGVFLFMLIMLMIMFGFAMAFFVFFKISGASNEGSPTDPEVDMDSCGYNYEAYKSTEKERLDEIYKNPVSALLYHYGIMLGEVGDVTDYISDNRDWYLSTIGVVLFVIFTSLVNIIMLNLLIAIMGDIFDKVQDNAKAEFIFGKASIICEYEETRAMKFRSWLTKKIRLQHNQVSAELANRIMSIRIVRWLKKKLSPYEITEESLRKTSPSWLQVLQPAIVELEEDRNMEWGGRIKVIKMGQENLKQELGLTKRELKEGLGLQSQLLKIEQERNSRLEDKMNAILGLLVAEKKRNQSVDLNGVSVSERKKTFERG